MLRSDHAQTRVVDGPTSASRDILPTSLDSDGLAMDESGPPPASTRDARTRPASRLLVVSFHFPPDPAIGGMRWAGLTKYLSRAGWGSWVVTAARPDGAAPAEVTVVRCRRRTTLQDLYRRWRAGAIADDLSDGARASVPAPSVTRPARLTRIRIEIGALLALPDRGRGWLLAATVATRRLLAATRPTAIVSSGPPHSAHLVAWLATRGQRVPWFVDLRDPWAGPHAEAWKGLPMNRSVVWRWLRLRLERVVFAAATAVICNTRQLAATLAERYPHTTFEWVPNGADPETLPRATAERYPRLGLVHAGTVYGGRDPGPVLVALRRFLDEHPDRRAGTCFRIAGDVAAGYAGALRRQVADLGLDRWVQMLGLLGRDEALGVVARSHLSIVLAQQQDYQVPAKLYEMVLLGTPTVVIASPQSAATSEAKRLGAHAVAPDDTEGLVRVMDEAWHATGGPNRSGAPPVSYAEIARQLDAILTAPRGTRGGA